MPTKEHIANLLGVLATASITGVGWAIGSGEIAEFLANAGSDLSSAMIQQSGRKLKARWLSSDSGILNHDIQNALTRAFIKALHNLQEKYFKTGEAHALPANDQETIRQLFLDLKEQAQDIFASSLERAAKEQVVQEYLLATRAEAADKLWKQIHGESLLFTYNPDFKNFLSRHLLNAVQEQFNEELKTDNRAWIAFQQLLLGEILVRNNSNLQELKDFGGKLDRLRATIDHRLPDEPFQRELEKAKVVNRSTNELIELLEMRAKKVNQSIKELKDKLNSDLSHWRNRDDRCCEVAENLIERTIEVEDEFNQLSKKLLQALVEGKLVLAHEAVVEIHQIEMDLSKQEENYKEVAIKISKYMVHTYDRIVEFTMERLPRVINGYLDGIKLSELILTENSPKILD